MNIITFDAAYCLYPRATVFAHQTLCLQESTVDNELAWNKYYLRGWEPVRYLFTANSPFMHTCVRWIGDEHTWVLPLGNPSSNVLESAFKDPMSTTSWALLSVPGEYHRMHFHSYTGSPQIARLTVANREIVQGLEDIRRKNREILEAVEGVEFIFGRVQSTSAHSRSVCVSPLSSVSTYGVYCYFYQSDPVHGRKAVGTHGRRFRVRITNGFYRP